MRTHHSRRLTATRLLVVVMLVFGAPLLAACGGSGKPSYCSSVTDLENSIKALPSTDVISNGTNALKSAFTKVQTDAQNAVNAAKSDFPTETTALKSSVDALSNTVKSLTSSPSPAAVAQLATQVSSLATAVKNFTSATSSKCG